MDIDCNPASWRGEYESEEKFMKIRQAFAISAIGLIAMAAEAAAGAQLTGTMTADNAFFAYISSSPNTLGTLIGSGNSWPSSFSLAPTTLTGGTEYLNIEAINYGGPGGMSAVLSLSGTGAHFANGTQTLTTDPSNLAYWSGLYNGNNSAVTPQTWVPATGTVLHDTSFGWGNIVGTPNWIWPSDPNSSSSSSSVCANCTVDFTTSITAVPEPSNWALPLSGVGVIGLSIRAVRRK
jgi:hypothetical protein